MENLASIHEDLKPYQTLLLAAPEPSMIIDVESGNFIAVNEPSLELLGFSKEEFLTLSQSDIAPKRVWGQEAGAKLKEYMDAAVQGECPVFDWILRKKNGEEIPCEVRLFRIAPLHRTWVRASLVDMREGRRKAGESRKSEERLQLALETAGLGYFDWYPSENKIFIDYKLGKITGFPHGAINGRIEDLLDHILEPDKSRIKKKLVKFFHFGPDQDSFETEFKFAVEGGLRHIFARGHAKRNASGEITRVIGTCQDVSEREKLKSSVEDFQGRWKAIAESSFDWLVIIDKKGTYKYVNHTAEGISEEDLIGKQSIYDYLPKSQHQAIRDEITRVFDTGTSGYFESFSPTLNQWTANYIGPIKKEGKVTLVSLLTRDISDRKRTEGALRRSQNFISKMADTVPYQLYVFDLDRQTDIYVNKETDRFFGMDLMGMQAKDRLYYLHLIHPEDRHLKVAMEKKRWELEEGEVFETEYRIKNAEGEYRWVRTRESVLRRNDEHQPIQIVGTSIDITSRKNAIKRLQESEQKFRTLFEKSKLPFFIHDLEGNYVDINESLLEVYGYEREEMIKMNIRATFPATHPEELQKAAQAYQRLLDTGHLHHVGLTLHKSGELFVGEVNSTIVEIGNQKLVYGFGRDMTEMKKAEAALEKSERRFRRVFDQQFQYMFVLSPGGKILDINSLALEALGVEKEEVVGTYFWDTPAWNTNPIHQARVRSQFQNSISLEESYLVDGTYLHVSGERRFAKASYTAIRDDAGQIDFILVEATDITEQKMAENALKLSEERFSRAFYQNPTPMMLVDVETMTILDVNAAYTQATGYQKEEVINHAGNIGLTLFGSEEKEVYEKAIQKVKKGKSLQGVEMRGRKKDGSEVYVLVFAEPLGLAKRKNFIISMVDITERKTHLEKIQESEERYRTLFELAGDAIFTVSPPEGKIVDANQAVEQVLGYNNEEFKSMTGFGIVAPEVVEATVEAWQKQVEEKGFFNLETIWLKKDGKRISVEVKGKPLKIKEQDFFQLIGRDISKRKEDEKQLRFQAHLLDSVKQAVIVTGIDGKIVYWNPFAQELYGWSAEEVLGNEISEFILPNDFDSRGRGEEIMQAINQGKSWSGESQAIYRGGREFPVLSTVTPIFDSTNKLTHLISISIDITERKIADYKLEKAFNEINQLKEQLQAENIYLREEIKKENNFEDMVYASDNFQQILNQLEQVAPLDTSVLIQGETGTGKELLARAVHNLSPRADKAMIKINCGAIPKELVESELFGYEKGAFTGATKAKVGRFELAHGGTLFLDEIGEMPLDVQVKLLRVLQEGEFVRLGATRSTKVNARVIAATNRDLLEEVEKGGFRRDLYFRLNVFPIYVPPLRERTEDLPILIEHFVNKFGQKHGKDIQYISTEAMKYMRNYSWPGNIRELENMIERAIILSKGQTLTFPELGEENDTRNIKTSNQSLDEVTRNHILKVLRDCDWVIGGEHGASKILNLSPSTLRDRMRRLGIRRPEN